MPVIFRDAETRSRLHLPDVGAWRYAGDASTDVWCVGFAIDDGPVLTWTSGQPIPQEFQIAATDPAWLVVAHNDSFESAIEERLLAPRYGWPLIPIERHRCTQAMSLAASLPAKLKTVAEALHLPIGKDTEGARLMREMSRPRKPRPGEDPCGIYWVDDPEKIRRLTTSYNVRDVELEREIFRRLPPLSDAEQMLWQLDATINRRGFHVDIPLAEAANKIVRERRAAINRELAELTGGRITSIAQVNRITDFLKERGHKVVGVGKRSVAAVLAHEPGADVERLLRLRQEGGKSSVGKLDSLLAMANGDRIYGALKFHGAATGRWSGVGFQPHNLLRQAPADPEATIAAVMSGDLDRVTSIGPPLEIVGSLSRAMICAAPGKILISADYSSIEPRVLCWLAGETWKLDAFRKFDATGDLAFENYCVVASRVLNRTVTPADEEGRQIGKFMELAFGYGGALGAFRKIAPDADFTDAQVEPFKQQWRTAHPRIVKFWGDLHRLLLRTARTGKPGQLNNHFRTEMRDGYLYLYLPSGRAIVYPEARVEAGQYDDQIVFKDNAKGKWADTRGWHGTFAENVVQAISRDLLTAAMQRLDAAGYSIVLHVHDEIVAEVDESFGSPEEFARLMIELPPWAEGLPVVAKASRRQRYAKDNNKNGNAAMDDEPDEDEPLDENPVGEDQDEDENETAPAAPITPADIKEINTGLAREGIEPLTVNVTTSTDAGDEVIEMASPALAAAMADMTAAIIPGGTTIEHDAPGDDDGDGDDDGGGGGNGYSHTPHGNNGPKRGRKLGAWVYQHPDQPNYLRVEKFVAPNGQRNFYQHHWNGHRWVCGVKGTYAELQIPYHLPELIAAPQADPIWICEGEKDADNVAALGLIATTNAGGAKVFPPELAQWFTGKQTAYVLEDNDAAGREHTAKVIAVLTGIVPSIAVVAFPELAEHGDVSDWLEQGGNKKLLIARAEQARKHDASSENHRAGRPVGAIRSDGIADRTVAADHRAIRFRGRRLDRRRPERICARCARRLRRRVAGSHPATSQALRPPLA
jgi:DNA polymerase